ncbi:hypothetical protein F4820DRAFT_87000 [Hypoxylon rubiginosum]|uniref:Uncharacterized protein n=1 Tax=Hypoxylon rubiginosum TaxID=110542 RepID=A0ACB9YNW1_9PEZI|nr:hypothetical protein F4820DRAFT_87000 [Hypoxylon rubiginosum]
MGVLPTPHASILYGRAVRLHPAGYFRTGEGWVGHLVTTSRSSLTATQQQRISHLRCAYCSHVREKLAYGIRKLSQSCTRACPAPDWDWDWAWACDGIGIGTVSFPFSFYVCIVSNSAFQVHTCMEQWSNGAMHVGTYMAVISPHALCMYYMHIHPSFLSIASPFLPFLNYGTGWVIGCLLHRRPLTFVFFPVFSLTYWLSDTGNYYRCNPNKREHGTQLHLPTPKVPFLIPGGVEEGCGDDDSEGKKGAQKEKEKKKRSNLSTHLDMFAFLGFPSGPADPSKQ